MGDTEDGLVQLEQLLLFVFSKKIDMIIVECSKTALKNTRKHAFLVIKKTFFSTFFREHFFSLFCWFVAKRNLFFIFQQYYTKFHDCFQQFLSSFSAIICL